MADVVLTAIFHNKQSCIGIQFPFTRSINNCVRRIKGIRWSKTHSCWYVPHTDAYLSIILKALPEEILVNSDQIMHLSIKSNVISKIIAPEGQNKPVPIPVPLFGMSKGNLEALARFSETLQMKAYSPSTIKTYKHELCMLLHLLKNRDVDTLTNDDLRRYILYCVDTKNLSENTIHSRLNALKFYFEQVLGREKMFIEIPRPKKRFQLPKVLGEKEIGKLFTALENKKHKAILFTAYSAGLRVSEVVRLQIKDIDSDRMQIFVENAKGKKDRYVMLSPILLDILRSYVKTYKPRPTTYLFEGYEPGTHLSSRSAQNIFFQAKRKAGLKKELSFHSLRHSFATHLLENGVDIKYIKDLLGHFSIHTTNRYLHVKRESLVNIISPLDAIYKSGGMDF